MPRFIKTFDKFMYTVLYEVITPPYIPERMKQEKELVDRDTFDFCRGISLGKPIFLITPTAYFIGGKYVPISKKRCINMIIARG